MKNFNEQFKVPPSYYTENLDFLNWFRYYFITKDVLSLSEQSVLEIGCGGGHLRHILEPHVLKYHTFDINDSLKPDFAADVRTYSANLEAEYNCVIAADVLEHLPFSDLSIAVSNIYSYLRKGGNSLITIPHRQSNFLFMTPTQIPHVFTIPTGFLSLGAFYRRFIKRKIWIDPDHCWEIGDGYVTVNDVESNFIKCGFEIVSYSKLLYVDYWILKK